MVTNSINSIGHSIISDLTGNNNLSTVISGRDCTTRHICFKIACDFDCCTTSFCVVDTVFIETIGAGSYCRSR